MTSRIIETATFEYVIEKEFRVVLVGKKTAILIVGMHRSGTSAVAKTLALHGCDLPTTLIPASNKNNERGYWESKEIVQLNDEILRSAESAWDDWRPFSPLWYSKPICSDFHDRALNVLFDQFGDSKLFILKDPRIARLLPFWFEVLKEFDADPSVLCPIRNPLDVAASLLRRDFLEPSVGRLLWLRHVLDAEVASRDVKRCFIRYESLLNGWQSVVSKVSNDLDISFRVSTQAAGPSVEEFLTPQLQHHKNDDSALREICSEEPIWQTFDIVKNWAEGKAVSESDIAKLDSIRRKFDDSAEFYYPVIKSVLWAKDAEMQSRRELEKHNRKSLRQLAAVRKKLESTKNLTNQRRARPMKLPSNGLSGLSRRYRRAIGLHLKRQLGTLGRAISFRLRPSYPGSARNVVDSKPHARKSGPGKHKTSQYEKKASRYDLSQEVIEENRKLMSSARHSPHFKLNQVLWFMPSFNQIFRGGIYTILRFATHFQDREGTLNTFVVFDEKDKFDYSWALQTLSDEFPRLRFKLLVVSNPKHVHRLPPCDVAICTFWTTAYLLAQYNKCAAKFYFIQDFEPAFHAAGSDYAMIEQTYQLDFFGVANTPGVGELYRQYNPWVIPFVPGVDKAIFSPSKPAKNDICRIVFYGRPSNRRNAFELGISSLKIVKKLMGNKVEIVSVGADYSVEDYGLEGVLENRGLLNSIEEVAELYRSSDIGLVFMYTAHPSYQPFEYMASGCVPVSNCNRFTKWFLRDGENCILAPSTPTAIAQAVCGLVENPERRQALARGGLETVRALNWEKPLEQVREFVQRPMPAGAQALVPDFDEADVRARIGEDFRKSDPGDQLRSSSHVP